MMYRTLLVLVLVAVLTATAAAQPPFVHEIVDPTPGILGTSMAFDARWNPHIVYLVPSGATYDVLYATRDAVAGWTIEIVATVNLPFGTDQARPEIAVAADGQAHVVYVDTPGFPVLFDVEVRYTTRVGGVWTPPTTIDVVGVLGGYADIDLDPFDAAHVSYYNDIFLDTRYSTELSLWGIEIADPGNPGQFTSIVINDPLQEIAHIAYHNAGTAELYYVRRGFGGVWNPPEVVDFLAVPGGQYNSIKLDPAGNPSISYIDISLGIPFADLKYAMRTAGAAPWTVIEFADVPDASGWYSSLAIDEDGLAHVAHWDFVQGALKYSQRFGPGAWATDVVNQNGQLAAGTFPSLALGIHGNPHVSHAGDDGLVFSDGAVHLESPLGGETWSVGDEESITWRGAGPVDIYLSTDGGNSYDMIATNLYAGDDGSAGEHVLRVPHTPSKFCVVKIRREVPFSESKSEDNFEIETNIALLNFIVNLDDDAGVRIGWSTNPGPEAQISYRLEKKRGSDWETLVDGTIQTEYHDMVGAAGDKYRLYAINGLGDEYYLDERTAVPGLAGKGFAAWPLPYQTGELTLGFHTYGALGSESSRVTVDVYDVRGRRVRRLVDGTYGSGVHLTTWDGKDAGGNPVASGVYFAVSESAGYRSVLKVPVVR